MSNPSFVVVRTRSKAPTRAAARLALTVAATTTVLAVGTPRKAQAENKFVDLHVAATAGGFIGGGTGTARISSTSTPGTTQKAQTDFFEQVRGPAAGIEVGVRLLVLDLSARFLQVFDGGGRQGTLSQLNLGFVLAIPVGPNRTDYYGRPKPGGTYICPSANVGFGIGTLGPIDPPLNNDQIAQKGLLTGGAVGLQHFIGRFFSVEARVEGGYHYFFGAQQALNAQSASSGWQLGGFGLATLHLGI